MPGTLIHHLPPLVAGKDGREQLVLSMEEASRLSAPPFSSQICCSSPHTAPATLLQLSAPTQQMRQGSQPALALTKNWIAAPSITHVPWHVPTKSFCTNTLVQLEGQRGLLGGALFLLPGCDQPHGASLHPGLEHQGPLSPPAATAQLESARLLDGKNFLIPCGAPHSITALTRCSTAWLPQLSFAINPTAAEL